MDDWEKFNETSLPEKEDIYSEIMRRLCAYKKSLKRF